MRVANVNGLVTLFYDGSKKLFNEELYDEWYDEHLDHDESNDNWEKWNLSDACKQYWRERQSWQQVIIEEGVTVIPEYTFRRCKNIKRVIMANTVVRIKRWAFHCCSTLSFIKLSINIEVIEDEAFGDCDLISVFIPPRCREIKELAFVSNYNLVIFSIPRDTALGHSIIARTKLIFNSHFEVNKWGFYHDQTEEVNNWLKDINRDEKYSLQGACSSYQPHNQDIHAIVQEKGIGDFTTKNEIHITPSQYLQENPFCDLNEMDIIRDYVLNMMGENE